MGNKEFLMVLQNLIEQQGKEKEYHVRLYAYPNMDFETNYADLLLLKVDEDNLMLFFLIKPFFLEINT